MPFRSSDFLPFKSFTTFVISSEVMGTLAQLKIGILGWGAGSGGLTVSAEMDSATEVKKTVKPLAISFSSVS